MDVYSRYEEHDRDVNPNPKVSYPKETKWQKDYCLQQGKDKARRMPPPWKRERNGYSLNQLKRANSATFPQGTRASRNRYDKNETPQMFKEER